MSRRAGSTRQRLDRLFGPSGHSGAPEEAAPTSKPANESLRRLEKNLLGADALDGALSLKERLERLVAATRDRPRTSPSPRPDPIAEPVRTVDEVLEGEPRENEHGTYYEVTRVVPLEQRHGAMPLSRVPAVPPEAFSMLARGDDTDGVDLSRALFFDTETTGLAGGSGTCPFLVGLGYVEGDAFVVRQLFLRDYHEEPALLRALSEVLEGFDVLVSYNGKTYDLPLMESRYVLSRQRPDFERMLHFDLLHPARSLWKARVESCRLMELESRLLGLTRDEDIPGHLIPEVYFRYLRTRDASALGNVFHHNRYDILSLAALTVCAADTLDESFVPEDPRDDVSLGQLFERSASVERAVRHYERALESGVRGAPRRVALRSLADHHKRADNLTEARALWAALAEENTREAVQALHEIAMCQEHRDRDFESALHTCDTALDRLEQGLDLPVGFRAKWREGFEHRISRLRRRLARA